MDKESELIEDDNVFVCSLDGNIRVFSVMQELHWPVSTLFFLKKETETVSRIYSVSDKEAFERIVFHSDMIVNKNDKEVEDRMDILGKLISNCKCFVFINGEDLKNDPKKIKKLIDKVIRQR